MRIVEWDPPVPIPLSWFARAWIARSAGRPVPASVSRRAYAERERLIREWIGGDDVSELLGVDPPQGRFREVSVSEAHACAIRDSGTLACWGLNGDGQATPPAGVFISVASGRQHTCARNLDDVVACWGLRETIGHMHGQNARAVHCGESDYTCIIDPAGALECTGLDSKLNQPPSGRFVQMDIGVDHACAVRADGTVACWGGNYSGQATPPSR